MRAALISSQRGNYERNYLEQDAKSDAGSLACQLVEKEVFSPSGKPASLRSSYWQASIIRIFLLANQHHSDLLTGKPASFGSSFWQTSITQIFLLANQRHSEKSSMISTRTRIPTSLIKLAAFDLSCGTGQIVKAGWRTFIIFLQARCPGSDLDGVPEWVENDSC